MERVLPFFVTGSGKLFSARTWFFTLAVAFGNAVYLFILACFVTAAILLTMQVLG